MALFRRSGMWRDVSPRGAVADLREVWRQAGANRWRFAFLSTLPTIGIFAVFAQEEVRGLPPPPEVTYITSWRADRSEAEIIKSNIANQKLQDRLKAEQAQREAEVRGIYEKIGRLSGMDVDAIKRRAAAERAAEAARKAGEAAHLRQPQSDLAPK